jgi:homoserine dehydrogenase
LLTTNPEDVLGDPEVDVVVEVMGGETPAYDYIRRAIDAKKGVVTANKMLLAGRAHELVQRAVDRGIDLAFEASVGGGIPIIRLLREALASDSVESLYGIVNGTSNYILTRMREDGLPFGQARVQAQAKGYAEADPTLDIDGHDAAHKMSVLAMLAFGVKVDHSKIPTEGIRAIEPIDHRFADRFDFVIKHLAIGKDQANRIELRVHPTLVPKRSVLANVFGVLNAIYLEGRALGPCLISGRGAGDMPTAVSVVADIVDVARSLLAGAAGLSTRGISLDERPLVPLGEIETRYYLGSPVRTGRASLSRFAGALGEHGVGIEQMVRTVDLSPRRTGADRHDHAQGA